MSSERTGDRNLNDRLVETFERISETYHDVEGRVRTVSPYVVRTIEVVLAIGLLAVLGHWLYWVYVLGV